MTIQTKTPTQQTTKKYFYTVVYQNNDMTIPAIAYFDNSKAADKFAAQNYENNFRGSPKLHIVRDAEKIKVLEHKCFICSVCFNDID